MPAFIQQSVADVWSSIPHYAEYAMYGMLLLSFVLACGSLGKSSTPLPKKPSGEGRTETEKEAEKEHEQ